MTSCKGIITDSHSFVTAVESSSKVKVLHATSADIKEKLSSCELNVLINVVPLPGIFSAHHLECIEDGIVMHPYTDANYLVNKLLNHCNQVDEEVSDSKSVDVKDIKNRMFVIVPYDFVTAGKKQSTKLLLALVLDVGKSLMKVQYGKPVGQSLKHFIMVPNNKGYVTSNDAIQVLQYPNVKRGIYKLFVLLINIIFQLRTQFLLILNFTDFLFLPLVTPLCHAFTSLLIPL